MLSKQSSTNLGTRGGPTAFIMKYNYMSTGWDWKCSFTSWCSHLSFPAKSISKSSRDASSSWITYLQLSHKIETVHAWNDPWRSRCCDHPCTFCLQHLSLQYGSQNIANRFIKYHSEVKLDEIFDYLTHTISSHMQNLLHYCVLCWLLWEKTILLHELISHLVEN